MRAWIILLAWPFLLVGAGLVLRSRFCVVRVGDFLPKLGGLLILVGGAIFLTTLCLGWILLQLGVGAVP